MDKSNIPGNAFDTLLCLWIHGPTWDGDVPSKAGRDALYDAGLCARGDGWQWLTKEGGKLCVELGFGQKKEAWQARQRRMRQIVSDGNSKRDHFTYCDKVMGDSHPCTCGMDAYAKLLRKLDASAER